MTTLMDKAAEAAASMTISVRTPYEAVLARLEEQFLSLQRRLPAYDEPFREAWKSTREATLDEAGWTEREFYAEMERRRRSSFPQS